MSDHYECDVCENEECGGDGCCEHRDRDHGVCQDCGKDVTESLAARAESAAEVRAGR